MEEANPKWKKLITKGCILYTIYMKGPEEENPWRQIVGLPLSRVGDSDDVKGSRLSLAGHENILKLIMVMDVQL